MIRIYTQNVNGIWFVVAYAEQVVASSFAGTKQKALSNLLNNLPFNVPFQMFSSSSAACVQDVFVCMVNILEGKEVTCNFDFAMDRLQKYTVMVLNAVLQIPLGYVSTYGAVARAVGGGSRAVGNVMAGNIFVPLIPCHRVVRANLSLGGYGGGLRTKYQLLMKEKRGYIEPKNVPIKNDGGMLQVYPVEATLDMASRFFDYL